MTVRRRSSPGQYGAHLALLPMALTALVGYLGAMLWPRLIALTSSRTVAVDDYVRLAEYARLFANGRWLLSLENLVVYGVLFVAGSLLLGFVLAVVIDRQVRAEAALR